MGDYMGEVLIIIRLIW